MEEIELRHERVRGDGVELHVARAGEGPPVILLHGFPENWSSWRHQIGPLVKAGFSVVAADMRGYNLSDVPANPDAYRLGHLVRDLVALVGATGYPRAHVVGHDWGGLVAWIFAAEHPELLDKLVILNAPHPAIFFKKVWRPPQLFRSSYVLFFQLPLLPERVLSAGNFRVVRELLKRSPARKEAFTTEDIDEYVEALRRPGRLSAALNYYRANFRSVGAPPRHPNATAASGIRAATLVIWGERDPALGTELLEGLDRLVPSIQIHRVSDSSHWVQNEAPDEVNRVLIAFLLHHKGH